MKMSLKSFITGFPLKLVNHTDLLRCSLTGGQRRGEEELVSSVSVIVLDAIIPVTKPDLSQICYICHSTELFYVSSQVKTALINTPGI